MEGRIIIGALLATMFLSCEEQKEHIAPPIYERDSVSVMTTYGVNTLISDSGIIKYKIVTERWDVNTVKNPSRWTFEKGVFFEQFDEKLHVEAYIQADSAWYYDQKKLWHLRGRVRIRNNNGLLYESEELFWDGLRHELYSNVFSKVYHTRTKHGGHLFPQRRTYDPLYCQQLQGFLRTLRHDGRGHQGGREREEDARRYHEGRAVCTSSDSEA